VLALPAMRPSSSTLAVLMSIDSQLRFAVSLAQPGSEDTERELGIEFKADRETLQTAGA
jgi:hypothetical protein